MGGGCHFNIWFSMPYRNLSKVLFLLCIIIIPEKKTLKQKGHQTFGQHNNKVNQITLTAVYYKSILIHLQGSDEPHWSNSRFLPIFEPAAIHQKRL